MGRHALIPGDSDVAADTFGSAVRLTGHVRTWAEHDAVLSATWMASGVTDVIDELQIVNSGRARPANGKARNLRRVLAEAFDKAAEDAALPGQRRGGGRGLGELPPLGLVVVGPGDGVHDLGLVERL